MLKLNTIRARKGSVSSRKRLGRGRGSGTGGTSGKGHKGQKARSGGGKPRIGFEGGQTPLYRRLPKVGFKNFARRTKAEINLAALELLDPAVIPEVNLDSLRKIRKIKGQYEKLAILGTGELTKAFKIKAHKVSKSAQEKITKAGGSVEIIPVIRHTRKIAKERAQSKAKA